MDPRRRRGTLWALGAAIGIAGWAIPWKLASIEGAANANALLLLAFAATFNTLYDRLRPGERRALEPADWGLAAALAVLTLLGNVASAQAVRDLSPALLTTPRLVPEVPRRGPPVRPKLNKPRGRVGAGSTRTESTKTVDGRKLLGYMSYHALSRAQRCHEGSRWRPSLGSLAQPTTLVSSGSTADRPFPKVWTKSPEYS